MDAKGLVIAMGMGAAVGAVAIMMTPKQSKVRKMAHKAANKLEDAVTETAEKIEDQLDM